MSQQLLHVEHSPGSQSPYASLNGVALIAASVFAFCASISLARWSPDSGAMLWLNRFSQKYVLLDHGANDLDRNVLSSAVLVALIWYAWFQSESTERRTGLFIGFVTACVAALFSRGLQIALPTHTRPLQNAMLHLLPPSSVSAVSMEGWSSFPSDHATLYFALATLVFVYNRRIGYLALIVAALASIARIYMGLHSFIDVIGGAMLGIGPVLWTARFRGSQALRHWVGRAVRQPLFYCVAFYASFCVASMFEDYRNIGEGILHALHHH